MVNTIETYRQEAKRCEERLARVRDPRFRVVVEQERRDWAEMADRVAAPRIVAHHLSS